MDTNLKSHNLDQMTYKHLPNKRGCYMITNLQTSKSYIGFANNIRRRVQSHIGDLIRKVHCNEYIQNDYDLGHHFEVRVLEISNDRSIEKDYIEKYNTHVFGYNIFIGVNHSQLTKDKIGKSNFGENNGMKGKPAWNRGIPRDEETKRKISETKRRQTDEESIQVQKEDKGKSI